MKHLLKNTILVLALSLVSTAMMAQFTVKGKVVDETKEGVPGANIVVKGTSQGVVTNLNGDYTISVPDKSASVLVVSFIGYETQEVRVGGRPVINITLGENAEVLNEVVVVGYGTQRKGDLTGALTTVKPDDIGASQSISVNSMLEGKVAGLVVSTANTTPGAASSITIRGANSLRGDNQPLYVIDNIPQASTGEFGGSAVGGGDFQIAQDPLSALNPSDIEDITILKDASATAIYGSRGANGVILITTKKGKSGRVKVQATANFTIAQAANLLDVLSLRDYAAYRNANITASHDVLMPDGSTQTFLNTPFQFAGDEIRYVFSDNLAAYDPNNENTYNVVHNQDWQRAIYRNAFSHQYNLSVSGGSDKTTYYVSAGYKDIEGTTKNTGVKQGDIRATLHSELSKAVSLDVTLAGSLRQNNMMAGGNTLGGSTGAVSRTAINYQPFIYPENDPNFSNENKTTVFSWINDYVDINNNKAFKGSLDLKWRIIDGLTYNLRLGGNTSSDDRKRWYGMQLYQGMNNQGLLALTDLNKTNYTVENVLNFNRKFKDWGKLDVTAGVTYDHYEFLNTLTQANKFEFMDLRENGLHMAGSVTNYAPVQRDYQLLSYLGRVNFTVFDRYLITASLRADGSSKFQKGKRWGYFPSASVAWRLNDEAWLRDVDWMSQLKVRLSYGVTGSQSIDPYQTFAMYGTSGTYNYSDGAGAIDKVMTVTNLANKDLTWETTSSWNLGVDFGFFNNRLNGNIDLYAKETRDLLVSRTLPGSSGFASTMYNSGNLTNKGIEFTLEGVIFDEKDFKWSVRGNIGANQSRICDLGLDEADFGCLGMRRGYYGNSLGDHYGVGHIFLEGEAPGLFFGYRTQGIVQPSDVETDGGVTYIHYKKEDGSDARYKVASGFSEKAGDIKFVDVNGDGVFDTNDRTIIGDPNPGFTYGFGTTLRWKDLQLSASFNGVHGREVLNLNARYNSTVSASGSNILYSAFNDMWNATTNPTGNQPASTYKLSTGWVMDRYVEDASYLRCSDITLTYNLPRKWMKAIGFTGCSVYGTVKNAFIITDYSGYDPEVNTFAFDGLRPGVDMNSYPNSRQWILGINITY
ncbi:MAG: TonB-dependent receptor [Bacteroidaceae bacterium]|nr:TonB-dependent receptor [Bacteroidaceae bacterium]